MCSPSKFSNVIDVDVGGKTKIHNQLNLYKYRIGKNCRIHAFVYIEEDIEIGDNCIVKPHAFIPTGTRIRKNVYIGPEVTFTTDKRPKASGEWELLDTIVEDNVSIGAGTTILPGIMISRGAVIGVGAVVTKDVPIDTVVGGNPAEKISKPD